VPTLIGTVESRQIEVATRVGGILVEVASSSGYTLQGDR
jgi:hypothetical protein